jgi:predicted ester cyclase
MGPRAERVEQARRAWNDGDLDGYLTLYDEAIALHGYGPQPFDKTNVVGFYRMIWAGLAAEGRANPALEFHEVLEDGALYCCRFTMTGVHQGDFMGVPATRRPYQLPGITVMRFGGDQVVERWSSADFLGLLTQLGAFPAPG